MPLQVADQTNLHNLYSSAHESSKVYLFFHSCFTGARDYSFTDIPGEFVGGSLAVRFSIPTDSIALEGIETFSLNGALLDTISSIAPAANEFVADPLVVSIQDVNGTLCVMD